MNLKIFFSILFIFCLTGCESNRNLTPPKNIYKFGICKDMSDNLEKTGFSGAVSIDQYIRLLTSIFMKDMVKEHEIQ